MDHNNLTEQEHYEQCPHGKCLNHDPEWEIVNKWREPNPGIFGVKTYWRTRCCGRPMARYKKMETWRCRKCGREQDNIKNDSLALCLCCGYHFTNIPPQDPS
jgi:hypothetical protein